MSWIKKLFGGPHPKTLFDEIQDTAGKLIVGGYRSLAASQGCAPTSATSDRSIIEIYSRVGTAFRQVSEQRGEVLPAGVINNIVFRFLQINEKMGRSMMDSHLEYELEKYLNEGLRPDYCQELKLF